MYRIEAVKSIEALQSFRPDERLSVPMPSLGAWLDPNHIGLVAMGPEGPVGGVLLIPCRQVGARITKFRLEWIYVLPEHRHHGLAGKLALTAAAEANKRGASAIHISVRPENNGGISWSESLPKVAGLGFVVALDRCGL